MPFKGGALHPVLRDCSSIIIFPRTNSKWKFVSFYRNSIVSGRFLSISMSALLVVHTVLLRGHCASLVPSGVEIRHILHLGCTVRSLYPYPPALLRSQEMRCHRSPCHCAKFWKFVCYYFREAFVIEILCRLVDRLRKCHKFSFCSLKHYTY